MMVFQTVKPNMHVFMMYYDYNPPSGKNILTTFKLNIFITKMT